MDCAMNKARHSLYYPELSAASTAVSSARLEKISSLPPSISSNQVLSSLSLHIQQRPNGGSAEPAAIDPPPRATIGADQIAGGATPILENPPLETAGPANTMDAAMVAKMTLDESASESRHPQQQQQQQQDDTYVQETSSSSSASSYSTTSSEMSSDGERRGSKSAPSASTRSHTRSSPFLRSDRQQQQTTEPLPSISSYSASSEVSSDSDHRGSGSTSPTNTRNHTRSSPFLRSDRQLQKTSESPSRPTVASDHTHDNSDLRRSSRKRSQRELLDTQSQPLSPSLPPTAPVLRSSTRSRPGNHRQASGVEGSGVRPKLTSTSTSTSTDQRRASRSATNSQQQRKRRHTSNAQKSQAIGDSNSSSSSSPFACSVDSQLDFEVSICTEGTAVPAAETATVEQTCFMCNKVISGDGDAVNAHIDQCLAKSAGESPSNEASDNGNDDGGGGSMMVAYEWDGQIRIRATAMLEGGVVAAGLGTTTSACYRDNDDDIDVDQEDETDYGPAQYTDKDLVLAGGAGKGRRRGRPSGSGGHSRQLSGPQFEEFVAPDDDPPQPQEGPSTPPPSAKPDPPPQTTNHHHQHGSSASQLVIDALKERINQQDRLLQSVQKCLICLEPYDKPCASIHCWHVYCEKCWMHTLGTKKLCPQCLQITQPTDLRRIYL
ncbi:hypothetical protein IWW48_003536 [Coemansia sp. RSA 1200]|nr:hypothetical protein IWW48_003536 [Coemansia sp. RSA 1200]